MPHDLGALYNRATELIADALERDISVAKTMLHRAEITRIDANRERSLKDAWTAYNSVQRHLNNNPQIDPDRRARIEAGLRDLKHRLDHSPAARPR